MILKLFNFICLSAPSGAGDSSHPDKPARRVGVHSELVEECKPDRIRG